MIFENVELTVQKLYRYCLTLSKCEWTAEDLVQEALLKTYKIKKLDSDRELSMSFLYKVAKNLYIDEKRKVNSFSLVTGEMDIRTNDCKEWDSLLEILYSILPLRQAMLITLKDVFGYSSKEIAENLRLSNEAVKTGLHRSRGRLKKVANLPFEHKNGRVHLSLSRAIKEQDMDKIFSLYRILETANLSSRGGRSMLYAVDPDGNTIEIKDKK